MPDYYLDVSDDWEYIDNKETIDYYPKSDAAGQKIRIPNCLRRAARKDFLPGTALANLTTIWHVWCNQMPYSFIPQIGDHIITVSPANDCRFVPEEFIVDLVEVQTFRTRFRLSCSQAV